MSAGRRAIWRVEISEEVCDDFRGAEITYWDWGLFDGPNDPDDLRLHGQTEEADPSDLLLRIVDFLNESEVVHRCPLAGSGVTPCCHRTPFELPGFHRLVTDDALVTCNREAAS